MKRRIAIAAATTVLVVPAAAFAAWQVSGSGSGSAALSSVGTGAAPQLINVSGTTVNLKWVPNTVATGVEATAYSVAYYASSSGGSAQATQTCAGPSSGGFVTCAITSVGSGTWYFGVTPQYNNWVGSEGPRLQVSVNADTTPPQLQTLQMFDTNGNGKIDQVVATFNETLQSSTATAPWTLTNVPSGGSLASVSTSGSAATLTLNEGSSAADTSVGAFKVALAASASGIRDAAGNQSSFSATAPADKAAPVLTALQMLDTNTNGKVDHVTARFSEALAASTATSPWTLANVPSAGSLASVSTSGSVATLTLTEGAGAADTSVGTFTVALATNAAGIKDAAGNQSSFSATAPSDAASPVPVSITDTNGATDGKVEQADTLSVTFSEPILASSVPSTSSLVFRRTGNGVNNIAAAGLINGTISTGLSAANYVSGNGTSSFTFNATLSATSATVKLTVGAIQSGSSNVGTAGSAGSFTYVPDPVITDAAGNAAAGSVTQSIRLF